MRIIEPATAQGRVASASREGVMRARGQRGVLTGGGSEMFGGMEEERLGPSDGWGWQVEKQEGASGRGTSTSSS